MSVLRPCSILALSLLLATGRALAAPRKPVKPLPAPQKVASVEGITEYRLANGLRVLLFPDPSKPTITTNITYLVGSRHENYGETGMAHLLEHLLFKGTPRHPDIPKVLNGLGGDFNGSTWYDRTNYYISFPASEANLRTALALEADRMVHSRIAQSDLWDEKNQRGEMSVVRNEFEMGENNPRGVLVQRVQAVAFDWHAYGKDPIGARSDIEKVNIGRLRAFYRKHYQPDNAVLLVAGRIEEGRALQLVKEAFGPLPRPARTLEPTWTAEPTQDGERSVTVRRVGGTPILSAGYHMPPGAHGDTAALALLEQVLVDSPSGRLYKALVETKLAASVGSEWSPTREPGFLQFVATLPKEGDAEKAKAVLLAELEGLKDRPATQEEVDRAKRHLAKRMELALNDTRRLAVELSESMAQGDWRLWFLDRDRMQKATPVQVRQVAEAYLKPANRTLGQYVPTEKPERSEIPPPPDAAALVQAYRGRVAAAQGEAFDATPATVEARTAFSAAPNGMRLALLPRKTKGAMVSVALDLRLGSEQTLAQRGSVPNLTAGMLMRGTARHTREELKDAFDRLKAQVSVAPVPGGLRASLTTTRENLPGSLRLLAEVLREPAFPASELETLVKQALTEIEANRNEPQAKVQEHLGAALDPYPAGHPLAFRSLDERAAGAKAAKVEDLRAFHKTFYGADQALFACVGDFDPKETAALAAQLLGDWKAATPFARIPARRKEVPGGRTLLETPDKQMAMFVAAQTISMKDTDPDYPAFLMANQVLGGGFMKSRLTDRIRQKEGLSYGAGSFFGADALDPVGQWVAYAIFAPQNAGRLEAAFREELEKALKDGFTAQELDEARGAWLKAEDTGRQEDPAIARWLCDSMHAGRSVRFQEALEARVKALKAPELLSALRKHLDPAKLVAVLAGDFAKTQAK
ncbi:MAG: insulinase family protein [Acidobacteria bacterium]|nr:insulinase family protein [Acidobacteriota bacterium]